jgi:hypothetical protein
MSDDTTPAPAAIPWYKAAVIRGILVVIFTHVIAMVAAKYHIDIKALNDLGINADALTQITLEGIEALGAAYVIHGRVIKPLPAVTLTKKGADAVNAAAAQPVDPPTKEGK